MDIVIDILAIEQARLRTELLREKRGYLSLEDMREPAEEIRQWAVSSWDVHDLNVFDEDDVIKTYEMTVNDGDPDAFKMAIWVSIVAGLGESELMEYGDVPEQFQPVLDAKAMWYRNCMESGKSIDYANMNFGGVVTFALTGCPQMEWR